MCFQFWLRSTFCDLSKPLLIIHRLWETHRTISSQQYFATIGEFSLASMSKYQLQVTYRQFLPHLTHVFVFSLWLDSALTISTIFQHHTFSPSPDGLRGTFKKKTGIQNHEDG